MENYEMARHLLINSYCLSAQRIINAIGGRLIVRNSSQPDTPPSGSGEIIGLCGQGGKHQYFRIPVNALKETVTRILSVPETTPDVNLAIVEIAGACQELRQRTIFDSGTTCMNDRLPSMVPLLPPEEIWLDQCELPLDVWRLISFDFDLVSSAVSSQLLTDDFTFGAVNQDALAFRVLLKRLGNRRATFVVEFNAIPASWGLPAGKTVIDVSLARVFCEAGALLTPLATEDLTKWYGAVRYLHWIDDLSTELRVKNEFKRDSVDSRYRGLFAEETAIGLMSIVLTEFFKANSIVNTVEVVPKALIDRGQPIADFVAQAIDPSTSQKVTIIAESKGSLGSVVSAARHKRAKTQLAQTRKIPFAGTSQKLALAFASTIRFSNQKLESCCLVIDPPADFESENIEIDPVQAWRIAYAKFLKFAGLGIAAQQVARGAPATAITPLDLDRNIDRRRTERDRQRLRRAEASRNLIQMDLILDVGSHALAIDTGVLEILHHGINSESPQAISDTLRRHREIRNDVMRGVSFETSLGIGCISYAELDERSRQ